MLVDCGSDGDLAFVQQGTSDTEPNKKCIAPQRWSISNSTFDTDKVGDNLEFIFPDFLNLSTQKLSG